MSNEIGSQFCRNTKYERDKLPRQPLNLRTKPPAYKVYENSKQIRLPAPQTQQGPGLWQLLNQRRSVRKFSGKAMSKEELSQILWAIQGVTEPGVPAYGEVIGLRTAPSAGGLYPVETYLGINNVTGIEPGMYHYCIEKGTLELINKGDYGEALARAALDQGMLAEGNVVIIWTAIFERSKWKYRQRAFRYVFLDAGHIAQNLALAVEGLGLGSCQVAAFFDDEVNHLLQIDGENESAIYLSVIGHKKKK